MYGCGAPWAAPRIVTRVECRASGLSRDAVVSAAGAARSGKPAAGRAVAEAHHQVLEARLPVRVRLPQQAPRRGSRGSDPGLFHHVAGAARPGEALARTGELPRI